MIKIKEVSREGLATALGLINQNSLVSVMIAESVRTANSIVVIKYIIIYKE